MKKQILLIAILFCTAFAQAQEVFVTADFVSSYIWRGMDSRQCKCTAFTRPQLERTDRLRMGFYRISRKEQ